MLELTEQQQKSVQHYKRFAGVDIAVSDITEDKVFCIVRVLDSCKIESESIEQIVKDVFDKQPIIEWNAKKAKHYVYFWSGQWYVHSVRSQHSFRVLMGDAADGVHGAFMFDGRLYALFFDEKMKKAAIAATKFYRAYLHGKLQQGGSNVTDKIAQKIKSVMQSKGISTIQLANMIGQGENGRTKINRLLRGEAMSKNMLNAVCRALGINNIELF